jgi:hypothetical protein
VYFRQGIASSRGKELLQVTSFVPVEAMFAAMANLLLSLASGSRLLVFGEASLLLTPSAKPGYNPIARVRTQLTKFVVQWRCFRFAWHAQCK